MTRRVGEVAAAGLLALALVATGAAAGASSAPQAASAAKAQAADSKVRVCTLLSADEIKKIAGAHTPSGVGKRPPEEEPLSSGGSVCNYGGVDVMLDVVPVAGFEANKARYGPSTKFEKIAGIGDAAYYMDQPGDQSSRLLGVYARAGQHVVVLTMTVVPPETAAGLKPTVIALGKAAAAKLH